MKRRRRASAGDIVHRARGLQRLLDAAGEDPDSELAQRIELLHLLGKDRFAGRLEEELAERAAQRIRKEQIYTAEHEQTFEGVLVGTSTDGENDGNDIRVSRESRSTHVGVFGYTGTGKTFFTKGFAGSVVEAGEVFWFFDRENDCPDLAARYPGRVHHLRAGDVKLNPYQPAAGKRHDPKAWIPEILDLIGAVYFFDVGADDVMTRVLQQQYESRGCLAGSEDWPCPLDVQKALSLIKVAHGARSAGWLETATRANKRIVNRLGATCNVRREMPIDVLARQNIVFDVSGLAALDLEFFVNVLLLKLINTPRDATPLTIILEEAHELMNPQRQRRATVGEPPLQQHFRQIRKRAVSWVIVDQIPGLLPPSTWGNLGSRVCFRLPNARCQFAVGTAMGLSKEESNGLARIPQRHALVQTPELTKARLVRIPELSFPPAPSEEELHAARERFLELLPYTPVEAQQHAATQAPRQGSSPPAAAGQPKPAAESEGSRPSTNEAHDGPAGPSGSPDVSSAPRGTSSNGSPPAAPPEPEEAFPHLSLSRDEKRLIERLALVPHESPEERVAALGWTDRFKDRRLRKRLEVVGVVGDALRIGKRSWQALTAKGERVARSLGFQVKKGKSGWAHEIVLRLVCRAWAGQDKRAKFRWTCGELNGRQADGVTFIGEWRCAIQVTDTTPPAKEAEAARDLARVVDGVLLVSVDPRKVAKICKALEKREQADREDKGLFSGPGLNDRITVISAKEAIGGFDFVTLAGGGAT